MEKGQEIIPAALVQETIANAKARITEQSADRPACLRVAIEQAYDSADAQTRVLFELRPTHPITEPEQLVVFQTLFTKLIEV